MLWTSSDCNLPLGAFWQVFFSEAESEPPRSICIFIEESGRQRKTASARAILGFAGRAVYGLGASPAAGCAGAAGGWPDELLKNLKKSESGRSRKRVSLLFNPFS